MQIIIAGCERVGAYIAHRLYEMGHDIIIIEEKATSLEAVDDLDCIKIQAKAMDIEAQRQAGCETADAFISVSSNENINVMAAEVAQVVFSVPRVLVRTLNQENNQVFIDMGLETVCSTSVQGDSIIEQLFQDDLHRHIDLFGVPVILKKESLLDNFYGKTVAEAEDLLERKIMAIYRDNNLVLAKYSLLLKADDKIVICDKEMGA